MIMAKLAAGIIGAGSIGNFHLSGYQAQSDLCQIQAICDITPSRLAEMGDKFRVPQEHRYLDYREMLKKEKLDLLSVCTPNAYHFECAKAAIQAGVDVLIEKPMVLTMEQARQIKQLAARKKVKVMVAFSHRFIHTNRAAKKLLDKGLIGKPFMIRVRYGHGGPYPGWAQSDWFYRQKIAGGGAILDMGIHAMDICQYFIGPIKTVSAIVGTLRKKIEVDDNALLQLDFAPAKCLGYIDVSWTSGPGFTGIEIYGDNGTFILDLAVGAKVIHGVNKPDGTIEMVSEPIQPESDMPNWLYQMNQWVKYAAGKKVDFVLPGIDQGIASLAVALAAMESSRTGKRIAVKAAGARSKTAKK